MLKTLFISLMFFFHPVHVSLTSIEYLPEIESFKVFVKVYYDDFMLDFRLDSVGSIKVDSLLNDLSTRELVARYLNDRIMIFVNGKQLAARLEDMESIEGEVKMHIIFNSGKKAKNVTVKNLFMTDLYKDQTNLLIFRFNDFEEGVKFTAEKTEQTFVIK
jgi:hypothetical protein